MEPLPETRGRGTRLTLVALGIFALLAIVGFASRSGFGGSSDARPNPTYVSYAFSIFLVLFVLAIPLTIYAAFLRAAEGARRRRKSFSRVVIENVLTFAVFVALAVIVLYLRRIHPHLPHLQDSPAAKAGQAGKKAGQSKTYEPVFEWPVLAVAIPLLVAGAVAAFVAYRRRKARLRGSVHIARETVAADVAASISDAIDDLEAEPDSRRAVIAAYARMEGALSRHGIPRRPSETPFEYLGRVLLDLRAPADAVRRLTDAFERAKFSRHEIAPAVKREAIDALVAVRDGLQAAAA
jgi:heme/copper-type cytochrome/quinol oxidase subunit 2